jgi:hypothetical protein
VQLRAWGDKQFSRVIGAVVRLMLIICGLAGALLYGALGVTMLLVWPLLPFVPLVGIVLTIAGYRL